MKVKSTLLLFFLLTICNQIFAQIHGKVIDANTGEPISFLNVFYDGKGVGTTTDDNGEFTITAHVGWNKLTFSAVGYQTQDVQVSSNTRHLEVKMVSFELAEVIVKPKRERYSRKNNPAVDFMRRVIDSKKVNDLSNNDYFSYNYYERLTLAKNNITADTLKNNSWFQKYPFFREQVEYSPEIGKNILPISVNEKVTQKVFRKNPHSEKDIVKGINEQGINELLNTGDMITTMLKDFFQKIDIYEDKVRFVQNPFESPIGKGAIGFYRYFLMDTLYVDRDLCVHLSFVPNNSQDLGFTGHLYVLADSTYRVKRCELNLPKNTGVNYVQDMVVRQEFGELPTGEWVQTIDDMLIQLNVYGQDFFVRRSTRNSDYSFEPIHKKVFKQKGSEIKDVYALMRNEDWWREYRIPELTKGESNIGNFVNGLSNMKGFKYVMFGLKALIENSIETGSKKTPSKIDLHPVNTTIANNYVDGWRFRASVSTTAYMDPHWFFRGYYAYGLRDRKSKYMANVIYSFNKKEYLDDEFPIHTLAVKYQFDTGVPSDKYLMTDKDNMFMAFKFAKLDQFNYERKFSIDYTHEREYGLKTFANLKWNHLTPTGMLFYRTMGQETAMQNDIQAGKFNGDLMLNDYNKRHLTTTELVMGVRYAPGETFINTKNRRIPINLDAPVFNLSHTIGFKGILGSEYNYNFTEAGIFKRVWFGSWGNVDTYLKGGIQWNKVPFPLLIMPAANLSYILNDGTFCLINNMEFLNDRYASLDVSWNLQGKIFNRIPLVKKLKWREFIGVKMLWGSLSDLNNPFLEENQNDPLLLKFPGHYRPDGSYEYTSYVMDKKKPYIEAIFGIHNIFKLLHVEYVRRLSYNELPTTHRWGVRFMIKTVF